jgi:hypothetical protein
MTNATDTLKNPPAASDIAPLRAKSGWIGLGFGLRRNR